MYLVVCPRILTKLPRDIIIKQGHGFRLVDAQEGCSKSSCTIRYNPQYSCNFRVERVVLISIDDILYHVVCSTCRMNDYNPLYICIGIINISKKGAPMGV